MDVRRIAIEQGVLAVLLADDFTGVLIQDHNIPQTLMDIGQSFNDAQPGIDLLVDSPASSVPGQCGEVSHQSLTRLPGENKEPHSPLDANFDDALRSFLNVL